jgi:opacity protein-like surface antigen
MKPLVVAAIVFAASPAWAQRFEAAPVLLFGTSISLDQTADDVDELTIKSGWSWGARGAFFITDRLALEGIWTYRETPLEMTAGTSTAEVLELTLNQFHANAMYDFGDRNARMTPFVFGGLGATFFSSDDVESETKLAWDVGAGVKWFFAERFGVEGRIRYNATQLQAESDELCGPFDFCQDAMRNVEFGAGFVIRF